MPFLSVSLHIHTIDISDKGKVATVLYEYQASLLRDRRGVTCLIPKKIPNSNGMLKRGNPLCSLNSVRDKSWIENLQNLIKR
jgi:hypothetical protein